MTKETTNSGPRKPWQPQTWQDLTRFSPLDFSLLSRQILGGSSYTKLHINTGEKAKNPVESLQWRRRPEIADFCPLLWSNLSWQTIIFPVVEHTLGEDGVWDSMTLWGLEKANRQISHLLKRPMKILNARRTASILGALGNFWVITGGYGSGCRGAWQDKPTGRKANPRFLQVPAVFCQKGKSAVFCKKFNLRFSLPKTALP